ncbi:MAG: efflux RND transporter periplasmic adaptor subunit [Deltaproteobacteria bacterium]|nr:efflux RND transporter periplasmic adaptor subunit [Deltaproteobacteria bacterium]
MLKRTGIVFSVALLAALPIFGCSKKEAPATAPVAAAVKPQAALAVTTASVEGRTVERSVEATGTLAAWDEVIVSSEIQGTVSKIKADLGDRVKAGDTLATLDQREASSNLEQAKAAHQSSLRAFDREKARLEDANANFKRYEELFKKGMVSVSQFDNVRTGRDVAEAQLHESEARVEEASARHDLAKKRMSDTVVKSPISGEVSRRFVSTGESVKEKSQMFTVVSTGTLKFRGTVAESAVPRIRTGQAVLVTVEAFKDKTFKGSLSRISPALDTQTRTLEIEAEVPNAGGVLKPGFFARGIVLTQKENGVPFVPEEAVYSFVGINKVFVINGDTAKELSVTRGVKEGQMIELIGAPLKSGDTVAASNLQNLYDGAKVTVQDKK